MKEGENMGKASTASKNRYNEKTYDQLRVLVKKGQREIIKAHAEAQGLSLNAYITDPSSGLSGAAEPPS